ncbi:Ribonuclease [Trichinella pseudospiralis]
MFKSFDCLQQTCISDSGSCKSTVYFVVVGLNCSHLRFTCSRELEKFSVFFIFKLFTVRCDPTSFKKFYGNLFDNIAFMGNACGFAGRYGRKWPNALL